MALALVNVETVADFIFLGAKITANVECSHEMKKRLLFGRKAMTNLESVLKSRDITLLITKVYTVKVMVFSGVTYWRKTIKKAGCQRIDALELWCWRRFLRVQDSLGLQIDSISPSSRKSVPNIHWKD